jgi:hypothetical protein
MDDGTAPDLMAIFAKELVSRIETLEGENAKLREIKKAAESLRQGIREAGVKREPALYERVMAFDSIIYSLNEEK